MASRDPRKRLRSSGRLLAYHLQSLPKAAADEYLGVAPPLTAAHMPEAKLYPSREAILHALPKSGVAGEVGTWHGDFARRIAETCRPEILHISAIDLAAFNEREVRASLGGAELRTHQGDSLTELHRFGPDNFDWLYADGDHSYSDVKKNLEAANFDLRPGGFLMCIDYTNWACAPAEPCGIARAAHEFCLGRGFVNTSFALHGTG